MDNIERNSQISGRAFPSVSDINPEVGTDFTQVTWAHAVDNRKKLRRALRGNKHAVVELKQLINDAMQIRSWPSRVILILGSSNNSLHMFKKRRLEFLSSLKMLRSIVFPIAQFLCTMYVYGEGADSCSVVSLTLSELTNN